MKRGLLLLAIFLFVSAVSLFAQAPRYTVWFKSGAKLDCYSYSVTSDKNYFVEVDGVQYLYSGADIEKVTEIEQAAESKVVEPVDLVNPTSAPAQSGVVYVPQQAYRGPYRDPFAAGLLSFFIPGVGQFYNGQTGAGFGFLLGSIASWALFFAGAINDSALAYLGLGGVMAINVWSIANAAIYAKKVSRERGYYVGNGAYLNLEPSLLASNTLSNKNQYHYGATLSLSF